MKQEIMCMMDDRLLESEVIDNRNTHAESVTSYTYDSVGNRVKMDVDGVTTSYEYNGLNQLTETECGNIHTVFTYDSIGNQILEENAETGATVENTYAVTGELLSTNISDGTATTYSQNRVCRKSK